MIFPSIEKKDPKWCKEDRGKCRRKGTAPTTWDEQMENYGSQRWLTACCLLIVWLLMEVWWAYFQMLQTVRPLIHSVDECLKPICFHTHLLIKIKEAVGRPQGHVGAARKRCGRPRCTILWFFLRHTSLERTHSHTHTHSQCHWPFVQWLHIVEV